MKYIFFAILLCLYFYPAYSQEKLDTNIKISIYSLDNSGNESPSSEIYIDETIYQTFKPLLSYVFFDENSSDIPNKYTLLKKEEIKGFHTEDLMNYNLNGIHYNVLNIIGYRLKNNPLVKLKIIGCNSNKGKENRKLSKKRAEVVRDYLVDIWGLDSKRIEVKDRDLPEKFSKYLHDEHDNLRAQENRRVEFEVSGYENEILGAVVCNDTIRTYSPKTLRFKIHMPDSMALSSWFLRAGKKIFSFDSRFSSNETISPPTNLDWELGSNLLVAPKVRQAVVFGYKDENQSEYFSEAKYINIVQTKKIKNQYVVENGYSIFNYQVIYFDYNSNQVYDKDKSFMQEIIKNITIKPNSKFTVLGYTDILGLAEKNQELSQDRAIKVGEIFKSFKDINFSNMTITGKGTTDMYSNDTPEGRFLNRTVIVNIKTPN